jgi:hypothetical protein
MKQIATRFDAVYALVSGGIEAEDQNDSKSFIYHAGQTPPSESAIDAKLAELQAAHDAQTYARNRAAEYPSIQDVTVALAEKTEGDSTMWDEITAKRAAIKTKYPKPE